MNEQDKFLNPPDIGSEKMVVDISKYDSSFGLPNKLKRILWFLAYWIFFRPFFPNFFKDWRAAVLRLFGAKVGKGANIYANVKIWAPWNLEIGCFSSLGPKVDCYNQGKVTIGDNTIVSQKTYLCASSHDFRKSNFPLVLKPISIGGQAWIAADVFVGPSVTVGEGAVVGARSAVFTDVEKWTIVRGNPAIPLKKRVMKN